MSTLLDRLRASRRSARLSQARTPDSVDSEAERHYLPQRPPLRLSHRERHLAPGEFRVSATYQDKARQLMIQFFGRGLALFLLGVFSGLLVPWLFSRLAG